MNHLVSLLIFSPLVGILLLACIPGNRERWLKWVALLCTLLPLGLVFALGMVFRLGESGNQFAETMSWLSYAMQGATGTVIYAIRYEVGINGLSLVLLMLTTLLMVLAVIASWSIKHHVKSYFLFFFLLELGMIGVFAAQNLFLFFIFFELTLVPMFFLIGRYGYRDREGAAYHFLLYNGLGSLVLLIVFVTLFMVTGTMNYAELLAVLPSLSSSFKMGCLLALLLAFGIKLPMVPLHSWMVKVHVEAPAPVVMLHSGVLLKIGGYGLIMFGMLFFPEEFKELAGVLAVWGVINVLYGAFLALVQKDLKRVLAYSSVSHMGIVLIGLAACNEAGIKGAILQLLSHGLISALLFFLVGILYERNATSQLKDYSGLAVGMPVTAGLLLAGGLASLGLPGMSGFVSEFLAFLGLFEKMPIVAAVGTLGLIVTAAYVLRAILAITFGEQRSMERAVEINARERVPAFILLALIMLIGVFPNVVTAPLATLLDTILPLVRGS
ncbi:NADH:ubiquinone oxidoreductase subunit M [Fictibacillus macauensis ZFHKF-1]|uniref:NADH:ubiquinone oxidoreductase subunit M n=1 Tax=Fictibacillus macauensis ZFHKF-1 TaxID=1196324 RepID=I8ADV9_9BACL|nr:NADH-quinone oxidoreductase subunit M [Fictibacillus macauensis]EIT83782.1 NADH:ubiquinone oxidoreductase subunit M [Fictibacillus macauensis ZFHKF-1]